MRCVFCGCSESEACLVYVTDEMREQAAAAGLFQVPDVIGCSWVSEDPPICSARICQLLAGTVEVLTRSTPSVLAIG